jgi:hypothetical protein
MSIIRQPAYITKSPISISVVGGPAIPFPVLAVVPAQDVQVNGVLTGTGRGKWVGNLNYYSTIAGPTSFAFSDLEGVAGSFLSVFPTTTLTSLSAPNLIYVGGNAVPFTGTITFSAFDLSKLQFVGGSLFYSVGANPTLAGITSVNLSSLVYVQNSLRADFPNATSINLSKLQYVGAQFNIGANSLTSLSLPSLIHLDSNFTLFGSLITTLTLPTLGTWKVFNGNFIATTIALNQASVDSLLAHLAYMDGNNGTVLYGTGRSAVITGTSSTPSNLGTVTGIAGSSFVGVGTTCTVNLPNHGYSTGDVLRVSGVLTLTNANIYAGSNTAGVGITVVNPNQFTYPIASQTATGTGTAKIEKAGASAKALVLRGVSLTTN